MANSQWLNDILAAIQTIAQGNAGDPVLQAKVDALTKRLGTDEGNSAASNAEFQTAIAALVAALHSAPPVTIPVVTNVSPSTGSVNGGETITLTGTNFTGATNVMFGTVAGTSLAVQSDTSLTIISPAQPAASVNVTVVSPAGTSAPNATYTLS